MTVHWNAEKCFKKKLNEYVDVFHLVVIFPVAELDVNLEILSQFS